MRQLQWGPSLPETVSALRCCRCYHAAHAHLDGLQVRQQSLPLLPLLLRLSHRRIVRRLQLLNKLLCRAAHLTLHLALLHQLGRTRLHLLQLPSQRLAPAPLLPAGCAGML